MTISPWAMLMTPITPKVMARPIAASSSTEPSDRPYQAFCTADHIARLLWIAEVALAAAAVVEAELSGAIGNAGGRRAGRGVNHLAVRLREVNFLGVGIGHQPAVLKRADDGVGKRIAAGGDRADGFFGIGKLVICEFTDRIFERPRRDRQCGCKNQQYCEWQRTKVSKNIGKHWTTPAEAKGRRRMSPPSLVCCES